MQLIILFYFGITKKMTYKLYLYSNKLINTLIEK